jgi:putative nucleotidyltransferase with HDIG domain
MATASSPGSTLGLKIKRFWFAARLWFIFIVGLAGTILALSISNFPQQSKILLAVNDAATQDILAPYAHSYVSEVLTEQAREEAITSVPDIYDPPDGRVARQQVERLRVVLEYMDAIRADTFATQDEQISDLLAIVDVKLDTPTAQAILDIQEARWQIIRLETISVVEQVMRNEIREDQVEEARRTIPALVGISLTESQAELVVILATPFIAPNAFFNYEATQAAREEARQAVASVVKTYAAGETIISRGEVAQPIHIEVLENYGLLETPDPWRQVAIHSLLVTILGCTFALYLYRNHEDQLKDVALVTTITILFVLSTLAMQLMIPDRTVLPYLFPAAMLPMLMATLIGPGLGVLTALIMGAIGGYLSARGLEFSLYIMLSGTMGSLIIGRAERLSSFFWAGLAAALSAVSIVIIFRFPDASTDLVGKASLLGAGIISGLLSASLGFGLLLIIGSVLGITTSLQLIELSRPDHPLLQFILRNAPGTYQHSLQVANLAEQAARAVNANPLLTRVGALYHDAGKAKNPQFFIENQAPGQNIHEQLDPKTSASVILDHIHNGLDMARKFRLPEKVMAFIPEHHGTLETSYQYHKALEAVNGEKAKLNPKDFRYPGPKPGSKETALLMLADGVEAKARAENPKNDEEIERLVRWVIENRLNQGQLDHVDLTLRDLDTIRRSFVSTLKGIYHPRISYPDMAEESESEQDEPQRFAPTQPAPQAQIDEK